MITRKLFFHMAVAAVMTAAWAGISFADYLIAPPPALGARPLGMGGAFVAVADDANAVFWNPAGQAQPDNQQALTIGGNVTERDTVREEWLSFVYNENENGTGTLALSRGDYFLFPVISSDTGLPDEFWYKFQNYAYSIALVGTENLYAGFTAKSLNDQLYNRFDETRIGGSGVSFDLGLIYRWRNAVTLGIAAQDVGSPIVNMDGQFDFYDDLGNLVAIVDSVKHPAVITAGMAVRPTDALTLAFDIYDIGQNISDSEIRAGLEYRPIKSLALRLGAMGDNTTFGIGASIGLLNLDLASVSIDGTSYGYLSAGMAF
ncbi:MAG: hypothetical protein PHT33_14040 [bacterium]|nr:hypothetical protein [bacterium]